MQVFLSPSPHCMGTQVTNYLSCIVDDCPHLLLSLQFLRVCSSGPSSENSGKKEEMRAFVSRKEGWKDHSGAVGGSLSSAWLLAAAIWGQARTELKRKPSRI